MFNPFRRSLRFKLVLVSVLIEVIMLSLLLGNSIRLMSETVEYHGKTLAEDLAPLLDGALSLVLFERDYSSTVEILGKLVKGGESDLNYIVVYDEQGELYAATDTVNTDKMPKLDENMQAAESDGVFDTEAPLALDDVTIGRVRFGISLKRLLETRQNLFQQGIFIAGFEVLLTILLLTAAGYFLTKHIKLLLSATRKVAAGEYRHSLKRASEDEIGELTDNFNRMTQAIRERVEQLKNSELALFEEKERAQVTLQSIGDGVITTDINGYVELINPVAERLTGWKSHDAEGRPLNEVFVIRNELTNRPVIDPVRKCLATGKIVALANHTLLESRDGQTYPIEDSAAPIRDRQGKIVGVVLVFHDVSGARHMARQMAYQARHDALTGLVNRSEFEERLRHSIDTAVSESRQHAMFYMDLDQFKVVNDTCGHFAGDELLKQLAVLLKNQFREADTLARLGGDEFGVLLENCPLERAMEIAEDIRNVVQNFRFEWNDKTFEVGVSIGVAPITQQDNDMAAVLSAADMACYIAKEKGRNRIYLHDNSDEEHAKRHNEMKFVAEISAALEEDRFEIYYQRVKSLTPESQSVCYNELLVRMVNNDGEVLPPFLFIPAAERFHLMHRIDAWVVKHALEFIQDQDGDDSNNIFAINLSGHSLAEDAFLETLVESISQSGIHPERLCFEITETAAISNLQQAHKFITKLKQLGCQFALDDFGSGLSSFAYLKNLPVDFLKIDGSFVKDILLDDTDLAMVEAINQIGHIMGLKTIAEYVEDEDIMNKVVALGVDFAQGFAEHMPEPLQNYSSPASRS